MTRVRKTSIFLVILVILAVCGSVQAKYSGGTGDVNDPYLISTPADLNAVGDNSADWSGHFLLTADIDMSAYTYTTALIAHDESHWSYYFQGTTFTGAFDGANHKIISLTIDTAGAGNSYLGLFGYIYSGGQVKNLGIENVNITGGDDSWYIGGLAGYSGRGSISNCYSTGEVTGGDDCRALGGLVGRNDYGGHIINCDATGSVTGGDYSSYLGGLIGLVGFGRSGEIENCSATGNVVGGYGSVHLGGLVGYSEDGTISNCYATGQIIGGYNSLHLGGLVGVYEYGTISNCYATGQIIGGDYSEGLGGLVGVHAYGTISNCYAVGQVAGGDHSESLGGLVGYDYGSPINSCFWDIEIGGPDNGIGTGLLTEQMQIESTFTDAGWDFSTPVWKICEGVDYARLWWEQIEAPVLEAEPNTTSGFSNTIYWQQVNEAVEYYAICSDDINFVNIVAESGWITDCNYTFIDLDGGRQYWYSVMARKNCVLESDWSNAESSIQNMQPTEALGMLADDVASLVGHGGLANSLLAKIDAAIEKLEDDNAKNDKAAVNSLRAFINAVKAQRGKKISEEDAAALIAAVKQVVDMLSGD
jgi:hypothetical protein